MKKIPFLPAEEIYVRYPLKRYLPVYHPGVISNWLSRDPENVENVLDPLGSNPLYALEAAEKGYRVFQAQKNPILRLMTETLAQCFSEEEYKKAIRTLLDQEWHGKKLDAYIRDLYQTTCRNCGEQIEAEGFIWKKDDAEPTSVVSMCPHCGEGGVYPIDETDLARLHQIGSRAIYRSRAMQRCMIEKIDLQKNIEYALACYTPRALHVVVILFNAIDTMLIPENELDMIRAVLLEVFDQATSLWHWPNRDFRPQQLSVPNIYFEKNIHQTFHQAIRTWSAFRKPCEVESYPVIPDQPRSICLFDRKTSREFFSKQKDRQRCHYFCVFPRPNQAFWVFSAIWSAWLFGKKTAERMLSTLSRQRFGWFWFGQAISTTFSSFSDAICEEDRIFGMCSSFTPSYVLAVLLGACDAEYQLESCAYEKDASILQMTWNSVKNAKEENKPVQNGAVEQQASQHLIQYLSERGEPSTFRELFTVYCTTPVIHSAIFHALQGESSDYYNSILNALQKELEDSRRYRKIGGSSSSTSRWMLQDITKLQESLDDRVERFIVSSIHQNARLDFHDLYLELCDQFPGLLTPDRVYCKDCLESYASRTNLQTMLYVRDADEEPSKRKQDLENIKGLIAQIGENLGMAVQNKDSLIWIDKNGKPLYNFYCDINACFSQSLKSYSFEKYGIPVIVFPASRSRLIHLKMKRNINLQETLNKNWHQVKFRHIRKIAVQEQFTLQAWQDILDIDPPLWDPPAQLKFI